MNAVAEAKLISADWGTTSLRLYLLGHDGRILDQLSTPQGMANVERARFGEILHAACRGWLDTHGPLPALLSGMVGARQGWIEAAYVRCPGGLEELAANLTPVIAPGFASVQIVPGMDTIDGGGIADVMRGEECQIVGALSAMNCASGSFVMPGTHSKWVEVEQGRITRFRTFMTGEVFAALRGHTILGRMMTGEPSAAPSAAFARGIATARDAGKPGEWLHRLFSVRTLGLTGGLADVDAADYLSGLIIGWEISAYDGASDAPLVVIANPALATRYVSAAEACGLAAVAAPADCAAIGHWRIAEAAVLMPSPGSAT